VPGPPHLADLGQVDGVLAEIDDGVLFSDLGAGGVPLDVAAVVEDALALGDGREAGAVVLEAAGPVGIPRLLHEKALERLVAVDQRLLQDLVGDLDSQG
jgi:hypothetical protein